MKMKKQEAIDLIHLRLEQGYSRDLIADELSRRTEMPRDLANAFVAKVAEQQIQADREQDPLETERFILDELLKGRPKEAVIEAVCMRAHQDWDQAERWVEMVASQHHSQLAARRNWIIIPLGLLTVAAGLVLIVFSSIQLWNPLMLILGFPEARISAVPTLDHSVSRAPFWNMATELIESSGGQGRALGSMGRSLGQIVSIFIVGFGMTVGGLYGLYRAAQGDTGEL